MADQAPLICRDIHKTFDQLEVLKGISLETQKGDVVSLSTKDLIAMKIPKLYVYGERDSIIPSEMELMFRNSAEPKQLITYDHAAHGTDLFLSTHGDDLRQNLLKFLKDLP